MARYTLPIDVDRSKGSIGGSCFQRNATQFTIRHRSVPTKKNTIRRRKASNLFGSLSSQFKSLTSGNRTQWNSESPNYPRVDSLGNPYEFNGLNMQVGSNANLRNAIHPQIAEPANGSTPATITVFNTIPDFGSSLLIVVASIQVVPPGEVYILYGSAPVTQMPLNPSLNDMRLVTFFNAGDNTFANIFTEYDTAFPNIPWQVGQRLFFAFRRLDLTIGQWSEPVFAQSDPIS